MKILVLGVGGNVSLGIIKAVRSAYPEAVLLGACITKGSAGLYFCDRGYLSPYADSQEFIPWLTGLCNEEEVELVLTGVEEIIWAIMEQYEVFKSNTNTLFIASELPMLKIGQDKLLTCKWLKQNGLNYPEFCQAEDTVGRACLIEKVGFPLIAKPRKGKGSNGIIKVNSIQEMEQLLPLSGYVLEEYIGSEEEEYTVGCYCSAQGKLMDTIILKRRLSDGATVYAETAEDDTVYREAVKICEIFRPVGPLNIQMRKDTVGRAVCFELNVRFSGTTPIRAHFGFCDVAAMIKEYILKEDISDCFRQKTGEVYRYIEELYLDKGATQELRQTGRISRTAVYHPKQK